MSSSVSSLLNGACLLLLLCSPKSTAAEISEPMGELIRQTCLDCHDGAAAEGGLDLNSLAFTLDDRELRDRWIEASRPYWLRKYSRRGSFQA